MRHACKGFCMVTHAGGASYLPEYANQKSWTCRSAAHLQLSLPQLKGALPKYSSRAALSEHPLLCRPLRFWYSASSSLFISICHFFKIVNYFTTRFTNFFGTTIFFTICLPSVNALIFSSFNAKSVNSSLPISAGRSSFPRTLPLI